MTTSWDYLTLLTCHVNLQISFYVSHRPLHVQLPSHDSKSQRAHQASVLCNILPDWVRRPKRYRKAI